MLFCNRRHTLSVFTGKGGVGKNVARLRHGAASGRAGRQAVLLVSTDPASISARFSVWALATASRRSRGTRLGGAGNRPRQQPGPTVTASSARCAVMLPGYRGAEHRRTVVRACTTEIAAFDDPHRLWFH